MYEVFYISGNSVRKGSCGDQMMSEEKYLELIKGNLKERYNDGAWAIVFRLSGHYLREGELVASFFLKDGEVKAGDIKGFIEFGDTDEETESLKKAALMEKLDHFIAEIKKM